MKSTTIRIEEWAIISLPVDPYSAPEMNVDLSLSGEAFGHPRFKDGHRIATSPILGKNKDDCVLTLSGSAYELGNVDAEYEKQFPGARERLLNSLKVVD